MKNKIAELRKIKNIRQADFAKYLNVSQAALSGYENGKYEAPLDVYIRSADYFGVTLDYLFERAEPSEPVQLPAPFPELSDRFARLDELDRVRVLAYMDGILAGEKYSSPLNKRAAG